MTDRKCILIGILLTLGLSMGTVRGAGLEPASAWWSVDELLALLPAGAISVSASNPRPVMDRLMAGQWLPGNLPEGAEPELARWANGLAASVGVEWKRDMGVFVMAMYMAGPDQRPEVAMICNLRHDRARLPEVWAGLPDSYGHRLETVESVDFHLFRLPEGSQGPGELAVCSAGPDLLVFGTPDRVRGVLDLLAGRPGPLPLADDPALTPALTRLNRDGFCWLAVAGGERLAGLVAGGTERMPLPLSPAEVDGLTMSIDLSPGGWEVGMALMCRNRETVKGLTSLLEALRGLTVQRPDVGGQLAAAVRVQSDETGLQLRLVLDEAQIERLQAELADRAGDLRVWSGGLLSLQ